LSIKNARMARVDPKRRPYYSPEERLAILALRAARGWTQAQTARAFQVKPETIASWTRRLDEGGEGALLKMAEPVNRFPDFVTALAQKLKVSGPAMGRRRIANLLARAGLHLGASTVRNYLRRSPPPVPPGRDSDDAASPRNKKSLGRTVTARYAGHVWNMDL